jgi:hypothetical protein
MKIRPVGAELFNADGDKRTDGQTDRQTDKTEMAKRIPAFRNFAKGSKTHFEDCFYPRG